MLKSLLCIVAIATMVSLGIFVNAAYTGPADVFHSANWRSITIWSGISFQIGLIILYLGASYYELPLKFPTRIK